MKSSLTFVLTAALATSGCATKDDDLSGRFLPGRIVPPGGAESDLPDPTVAFLGEIESPAMHGPRAVAVAPDATIYVADPLARKVHKFTPRGVPAGELRVGLPMGVTVDDRGHVYVSDVGRRAVRVFDEHGGSIGYLGVGAGELEYPMGVAWDSVNDTIVVADRDAKVLRVFSTSGTPTISIGGPGSGDGELSRPVDVAIDAAAGLYFVVDAGSSRIQTFDREGAHLGSFGSEGSGLGQFTRPTSATLDSVGRLYVTDAYQSMLQVVDTDGGHVSYLGEFGKNYGQVNLTTGAAIDPYNRLLVASYTTRKIVIYGIDDFTQPAPEAEPLSATVALTPPTINGRSAAPYLHAQIALPGTDVHEIDVESVRLHGLAREPAVPPSYADTNGDGVDELVLCFSRADVLAAVPGAGSHTLALSGALSTGNTIIGAGVIHVLEEVP